MRTRRYLLTTPRRAALATALTLALAGCDSSSPAASADASTGGTSDGGTAEMGGGAGAVARVALDRTAYLDRMAALWMGESIANWTGLITEGRVNSEPYLTDDDWDQSFDHTRPGSAVGVLSFNFQDPWLSDDDTDIEYIYLSVMNERGTPYLTAEDIRDSWLRHTEPGVFIWVSNLAAQTLMFDEPTVLPPSTSLLAANDQSLMIDAQLTTEIFGALSPGMPRRALALAELPIRTSASGSAEHAAQMFVVMYSLAAVVDPLLTPREQVLWIARTSRSFIPDASKTAAVFDFVLEDYLSNADAGDWERTRDAVAGRFGPEADPAGAYLYVEWYESAVNFATGILALLYGEGDLRQTIRIGALSGWDSDNGTATMGGLLGVMLGTDGIRRQFPGVAISNGYRMRTRSGFEPGDVTFDAIALQMAPLLDIVVSAGGGVASPTSWDVAVEDLVSIDALRDNPRLREGARSVNNYLRARGMVATVATPGSTVAFDEALDGYAESSASADALVDGLEFDVSGIERRIPARTVDTFPGEDMAAHHVALRAAGELVIEITYPMVMRLGGVQLVEGPEWSDGRIDLASVVVEVRSEGTWREVTLSNAYLPQPEQSFEIHSLTFASPATADAVRIRGMPNGSVVTLCEVDATLAD